MRTIMISEPGKVAVTETEMPEVKEGEALLKLLYGVIIFRFKLYLLPIEEPKS